MSDELIDARGLLCPLPVLRLRKRLSKLASGEQITLWADDPAAAIDVPHFCAESGHKLVATGERQGAQTYRVQKA
ncbi:sulfurtransferase TusA family protein [Lentibacter algarum]|uniref:sulfurtransferase TusA family protein n=1 Tax=Lentibacter algarum TaxID=576131 RepID=UPI001C06EB88|nr:sulfurtransferase TusA family protein [Lentibacter algarum]MBU2982227.1 sulfurtransferase TusA family protein [Lentibacter algarum]